ncbi:MAG: 4-hydroxy-tetrahydrodipicolinate reductase, partial [Betaproteobacteria bacterium]
MNTLALFGVTGRMGQKVLLALSQCSSLALSGATASTRSPSLGQRLTTVGAAEGGASLVAITSDPVVALKGAAVALDFSQASVVRANLAACVDANVPVVIAVTGLDAATRADIEAAGKRIAVLPASNMSVGVAVMNRIAKIAAASLPGFDIEISEAHHRHKRDAPSGTALTLGDSVAQARGRQLADVAVYAHHGSAESRREDQICFSVVRGGDIVGVHTVLYAGIDETLEITHRATDRLCFARGAL